MTCSDANLIAGKQHDGVGVGVVLERARRVIEHAFGDVVQGEPARIDGCPVGFIGVEGDEVDLPNFLAGLIAAAIRGCDVVRNRSFKCSALLGRSSREHIYAREPCLERAHRSD